MYTVQAYNSAKDSENKIHDDSIARRFGFGGGLVPGVDVYAYMTHLPVQRWGRAWLERGTIECRFAKPVYDGNQATVTADGPNLQVHSQDQLCATGRAALPAAAASHAPREPVAARADRPPADEASLATGTLLGIRPLPLTAGFMAKYLIDVRETDPLYARERLAHPGTILRVGNWLLSHNVVLGPWIHVGSTVTNLATAREGETLTAQARVANNYQHKGHRFVELDALVCADAKPVAHITHVAIYRPRQVAAAE